MFEPTTTTNGVTFNGSDTHCGCCFFDWMHTRLLLVVSLASRFFRMKPMHNINLTVFNNTKTFSRQHILPQKNVGEFVVTVGVTPIYSKFTTWWVRFLQVWDESTIRSISTANLSGISGTRRRRRGRLQAWKGCSSTNTRDGWKRKTKTGRMQARNGTNRVHNQPLLWEISAFICPPLYYIVWCVHQNTNSCRTIQELLSFSLRQTCHEKGQNNFVGQHGCFGAKLDAMEFWTVYTFFLKWFSWILLSLLKSCTNGGHARKTEPHRNLLRKGSVDCCLHDQTPSLPNVMEIRIILLPTSCSHFYFLSLCRNVRVLYYRHR